MRNLSELSFPNKIPGGKRMIKNINFIKTVIDIKYLFLIL